jgi:hypothetical protein
LISNKDEILENFEVIKHTIFNDTALEVEYTEVKNKMAMII